ncbi:uncharacterized protein TRIADDRAFT_21030 [Trichoplax adhaerens]|uniref:Uncharacterized protein n=1 Tax=Trichoplax adhaerens TaxID=10228 RepID=B3RNW5_TRIAD|nr:hypothetical protein TRIADDRAFT_21030 [Trichoplax adhaerens]EDV27532.1 hypothetical protein TRIADDRAFT_21030 [Trichoplax adhaerens]|eukprot:XP_002109366.1 hypothetical protein TRIADDRAFT_21030 [Trichoplax adhaerens]
MAALKCIRGLVLSLVIITLLAQGTQAAVKYKTKYFDQIIDHFDWKSNATYRQRYLMNDDHWDKGTGPIFFYTGNEGGIVGFWQNSGLLFDLAPQFRALIVFGEHRYYGKSLPFGKDSFKPKNLGLLTSEQALADYAVLLTSLKKSLNANKCKVVAFGGSYGGMLTAWMRLKYPNIIDAGLAASAPLYMAGGVVSPNFFFPAVTKDYQDANPKCVPNIRKAFSAVLEMAKSKSKQKVAKIFNVCNKLKTSADVKQLIGWIRNGFVSMAMGDYPYPASFFGPLPAFPVNASCKYIVNASHPIQGMAKAMKLFYGSKKCHDIYKQYVHCADPTGCGTGASAIPWDYQACTEILLPGSTNNKTDMFPPIPFTSKIRKQYCLKKYGVTPRPNWVATQFWANRLKGASNIIFSNGNLDPWKNGGILKSPSSSLVAIQIPHGAHHLDLRGKNKNDPASVIKARKMEAKLIKKWISS